MKKLILILAILSADFGFGQQDTIFFTDASKVPAVIVELSSTVIRYRKADNPDGPLYVANVSEIRSITYRNGMQESFAKKQVPAPVPAPIPETKPRERSPRATYDGSPTKYSGPRIGMTYIGPGSAADEIRLRGKTPVVSQFGWQFETRIFTSSTGISGLAEFVPLIGGMEQGLFLPSASLLFGLRVRDGLEVAVGPNLSLTGLGMVLAVGTSFHLDDIYFPVNLVFVPNVTKSETETLYNGKRITTTTNTGFRISLIVGFNIRRQ
jgi:hypothetical protein